MNKSGKSMENIRTYIIILFIIILFVTLIQNLGEELLFHDNANLDDNSKIYITNLQGINLTDYQTTSSAIEQPILFSENTSQGNPKDFALEFQFAKEQGLSLENTAKLIFSTPGLVIYDLLQLPVDNWAWVINLINWLWRLLIIIAVVYFARGLWTN